MWPMATNRAGAKTGKTRTNKTPAQRATEAYDTQARIVKRLADKLDPLRAELAAVEVELEAARKRLDYLGTNPDLPDGYGQVEEPPANTDGDAPADPKGDE